MDYQKLNSITVRDAFPLPRIDEALQAVHSSNWFSSFDLAQGYLQLAMDESDIKKTAFRAGSTGLYEFTRMPFGLSNEQNLLSIILYVTYTINIHKFYIHRYEDYTNTFICMLCTGLSSAPPCPTICVEMLLQKE